MLDAVITHGPGDYLKLAAADELQPPQENFAFPGAVKTETTLLPGWEGWNPCPRLPAPPGAALPPDTWLFGAPWGPAVSWFLPLSSCDPCAEPASMKPAWMAGTPWCSSGPQREVGPPGNATASDEACAFFLSVLLDPSRCLMPGSGRSR